MSANLADNLRRLRESRGLTQQELCERSGVPRPTLAHLESGTANPTLSVLSRVAQALSVAMEELVMVGRPTLTGHAAKALPETERDGASVRTLCPESAAGLVFERIELAVKSELARAAGRKLDACYLACERGEVEVASGQERALLRTGDVVVVSRGAEHSFLNRGRGSAVVYSVRSLASA